jgi:hypothetical protein
MAQLIQMGFPQVRAEKGLWLTGVCVCVCVCVFVGMSVCVCVYVCTFSHRYVNCFFLKHTHTNAHTHILTGNESLEKAVTWLADHSEDADVDVPLSVAGPSSFSCGAEQSADGLTSANAGNVGNVLGGARRGVKVARKITDFSIHASQAITEFWVGFSRVVLQTLPGGEEGDDCSWLSEDLDALLHVLALAGNEFAGSMETPSSYWATYRSLTALVKLQRALPRPRQPLAAHLQARSSWLDTNLECVLRYLTYAGTPVTTVFYYLHVTTLFLLLVYYFCIYFTLLLNKRCLSYAGTSVTTEFYCFTLQLSKRFLTFAEAAMEGTTAPLKARLGLSEESVSQDHVVRALTGCSRIVLSNWKVLLQYFATTVL